MTRTRRGWFAALFFASICCILVTLVLLRSTGGSKPALAQEETSGVGSQHAQPPASNLRERSDDPAHKPIAPPPKPDNPQRSDVRAYESDVVAAVSSGIPTVEKEVVAIREALSRSGRSNEQWTGKVRDILRNVVHAAENATPNGVECFNAGCIVEIEFESQDAADNSRGRLIEALNFIPSNQRRLITGVLSTPRGAAITIVVLQH